MTNTAVYCFCRSLSRGPKGTITTPSLLLPTRNPFSEGQLYDAVFLDSRVRRHIRCELYGYCEVAISEDEHGKPLTLWNGEPVRHDTAADAVDRAENRAIRLILHGDDLPLDGPALISTEPGVAFVSIPVVADVLCNTLSELPDFIADSAEAHAFENALWPDPANRPPLTHTDEVDIQGKKLPVSAGLVIPFSGIGPVGDEPGVVVLTRKLAGTGNLFAARLFASHEVELHAGTLLRRHVVYGEAAHSLSRDVARIVSVDPG